MDIEKLWILDNCNLLNWKSKWYKLKNNSYSTKTFSKQKTKLKTSVLEISPKNYYICVH